MDLLKNEGHLRERQGSWAGRLDDAIQPEYFCDHDILWWREVDGVTHNRRNPEMCNIDDYSSELIRSNDVLSGNRTGEVFVYRDSRTQINRIR